MIVIIALVDLYFALAKRVVAAHKRRAFQASSPKNFSASLPGLAFFSR
jgi:hypothetical protein